MDFKQALITVLSGMAGTLGFSILFKSDKRRMFCNALGGALTCVVYLICCDIFEMEFFQNMFPALFATAYSEVMARIEKAPTTPILACSIISLVPGSKLYYTTYHFVMGNMELFDQTLIDTLKVAAGLAAGIICVSVVVHEVNRHKFRKVFDLE